MNAEFCSRTAQRIIGSLIILFAILPARADLTTNLPPSADTALLESLPDNNLGQSLEIPAGGTAIGRSRALFKFDLTALPANATITSAALMIQVTKKNTSGAGSVFDLHRILQSWEEGLGTGSTGAMANTNEVTWNDRSYPSTQWTTAGGGTDVDYTSAASATNFIDQVGSYTFDSTPGLVADVQAWLNNPDMNFGWLLISESENVTLTARRIASREDPINGPPLLKLGYTLPVVPPPGPPTISQARVVGNEFRFLFHAEAGHSYSVEIRKGLESGNWLELTNFPSQPADADLGAVDIVNSGNSFYRIRAE